MVAPVPICLIPIPLYMLIENVKVIKWNDDGNGWGQEKAAPTIAEFENAFEIKRVWLTTQEGVNVISPGANTRTSTTRLFIDKVNSIPKNYANIDINEKDYILHDGKIYVVKAKPHFAYNKHHMEVELEVMK